MSNSLSTAIENLVAAEQQVNAISGLPPAAQQIKTDSSGMISSMVPVVRL